MIMDKEIAEVMAILATRAEAANPPQENDYVGDDGLLYCWRCHTQKQCRPFAENPECVVYCLCKCEIEKQRETEERMKQNDIERARKICFTKPDGTLKSDIDNTFDADDSPQSEPGRLSRGYAKKFDKHGDWLLLCGTNGIGKSFYAACICNELVSKGVSAKFTNISEIETALWDAEDKSEVYCELARYDVLVIDDFGAERDTSYIHEIQFDVLDSRLRLNKPCIITTNLSSSQLWKPQNQTMERIFSRIFEKAIPLTCKGEDRRKKTMQDRLAEKLKKYMEDDESDEPGATTPHKPV